MENFIRTVLEKLTVEEKISLVSGTSNMGIGKIPRLGIREVFMADGPQGIRREGTPDMTNTALPCGLALAASFDTELAQQYGGVIAEDARSCGIRASLGPGMNLMRTPLNGRTFEYYGEDPVLSGRIAAGYIKGCQAKGVAACPKHLALNNQEICRTIGNSICDHAVLRDLYLENFEIAVTGGKPQMVMTAYNKINGIQASEYEYTQKKFLREECGFDGVTVSDWGGTHDIKKALLGGQDLEMGGGENTLARKNLAAHIKNGDVPMDVLDNAVLNNLRLLYRMGAFDKEENCSGYKLCSDESLKFVRRAAVEGAVLLENKNSFLPLERGRYKKITVTGPSANFKHHIRSVVYGGGSGATYPPYEVTVYDALKARFGADCEVNLAPGILHELEEIMPEKMIREDFDAEYFDDIETMYNGGEPFLVRKENPININYGSMNVGGVSAESISERKFAGRLHGFITPVKSGHIGIQLGINQMYAKFRVNGKEITCGNFDIYAPVCELQVEKDVPVEIDIEVNYYPNKGAGISLRYFDFDNQRMQTAIELAAASDLVIYVGGSNHIFDKEGIGWGNVPYSDIPSMKLPYGQSEFIAKLYDANPNICVVLLNGSALEVEEFADKVPAMLEMFYPGMECGNAVADILFGEKTPQGRLPFSWCRKLEDYPPHANKSYPGTVDDNAHVNYLEGMFIGYRYMDKEKIDVRYPFGYGLSYGKFEHEMVETVRNGAHDFSVRVRVKNISDIADAEVIQLYVGSDEFPERPVKALRDFVKVKLNGNEEKIVELKLGKRDFSHYSRMKNAICFYPGKYNIYLGTSANDIFAASTVEPE